MNIARIFFTFALLPAFAADLRPDQVLQVTMSDTEVFLKNISNRLITAYNYDLRFRFPDGSIRKFARGMDELDNLLSESLVGANGTPTVSDRNTPLRPGITRTLSIGAASSNGMKAIATEGIDVAMIAFEDGSVIGTGAFQNFRNSRVQALKRQRALYEPLILDLRSIGASSSPADRLNELSAAKSSNEAPMLRGLVRAIQQTAISQPPTSRPDFQRKAASAMADTYQALLDGFEKHLKLMDTANAASAK